MVSLLTVPGVYTEPAPRREPPAFARTDIAGFVGFEPRVRNAATPSHFTGTPITGHRFAVRVSAFQLRVGDRVVEVPSSDDWELSASSASPLLADGESVAFGLAVGGIALRLAVVKGPVATTSPAPSPGVAALDAAVETVLGGPRLPYVVLADVEFARVVNDLQVTIRPQAVSRAIRQGSTPSSFLGTPPSGHTFQVDIEPVLVLVGDDSLTLPALRNFALSSSPFSPLVAPGERIVFSLVAIKTGPRLVSVQGPVSAGGGTAPPAPDDTTLAAAVQGALGGNHPWRRIADIEYRRQAGTLRMVVRPAIPPVRCDDWRDFIARFGAPMADGTLLAPAVCTYFANGGNRCWIATVSRPCTEDDSAGLTRGREEMIGVRGSGELEATGLERLLLLEEVSVVDLSDLYARRAGVSLESITLPPARPSACFAPCGRGAIGQPMSAATREVELLDPLYLDDEVFDTQRRVVERCAAERWRVLVLLTAPLEWHPAEGRFGGPTLKKGVAWRNRFFGLGSPEEMSVAAMYMPWVLHQERVDGPVVEMPPTPFVAGVIARRDLARGPAISPANETLRAVVGLTWPVGDVQQGEVYAPPRNINVVRAFAGYGVQLWGARTLSDEKYLRYLSVRRALTAIEREAFLTLQRFVFEPNSPLLWLQLQQFMFDILLRYFQAGALRGDEPSEAFFVRCDSSNNTAESIATGRLLIEIGVALAAPAEFIVFRMGRREGVIEVVE